MPFEESHRIAWHSGWTNPSMQFTAMMSFHVYATHDSPSREFSLIFRFSFAIVMRDGSPFSPSPVASWSSSRPRLFPSPNLIDAGRSRQHCIRMLESELVSSSWVLASDSWLVDWFIKTIQTWFRLWNHRQQAQLVQNDGFIASLTPPVCEGSLLRNFGVVRGQ